MAQSLYEKSPKGDYAWHVMRVQVRPTKADSGLAVLHLSVVEVGRARFRFVWFTVGTFRQCSYLLEWRHVIKFKSGKKRHRHARRHKQRQRKVSHVFAPVWQCLTTLTRLFGLVSLPAAAMRMLGYCLASFEQTCFEPTCQKLLDVFHTIMSRVIGKYFCLAYHGPNIHSEFALQISLPIVLSSSYHGGGG